MKKIIILSIVSFLFLNNSILEACHRHHGLHGGWSWSRPYYNYGISAGLATSALINDSRKLDTIIIKSDNHTIEYRRRINNLEDENASLKERLNKLEYELNNRKN